MKLWEFHPALVHFPLALLIGGMALDMFAACRKREAMARFAAGMLVWGVAAGWIAGVAGVVAWFTAPSTDETFPLMVWHPL
ncbi:MAG TPA: DUF2231 domain-containing protein, partial [Candidatus Dormibacteraeota bacterium]|nr:DUF2231 domain-containing protein [Candidatus Dormibacteraeota bacterium]